MVPETGQPSAFGPKMSKPAPQCLHETEGARVVAEILSAPDSGTAGRNASMQTLPGTAPGSPTGSTNGSRPRKPGSRSGTLGKRSPTTLACTATVLRSCRSG